MRPGAGLRHNLWRSDGKGGQNDSNRCPKAVASRLVGAAESLCCAPLLPFLLDAQVFEAKAVPAATLTTSPAIKPEAGLQATAAAAVLPEDTEADSVSIYVKNLAWATTDKGLHAHFAAAAEAKGAALRSARVARKAGPDGKPLSAGYGFVECATEAAARELIGALQVGGQGRAGVRSCR